MPEFPQSQMGGCAQNMGKKELLRKLKEPQFFNTLQKEKADLEDHVF